MRPNLRSFGAVALIAALASGLLLLLTGPGYRIGIWSIPTAFAVMRWAVYGGVVSVLLAAVALWRSRGRTVFAALALLIGLLTVAVPLRLQRLAAASPPIHDITTDTANPPIFHAVVPLRQDARNSLEYSPEVGRQQREAYPDLKPLVIESPVGQVFDRAVRAARDAGWELVEISAEAWRIEATDTTPFFGFKDDIVVRLTPLEGRTIVDVRSVSRVGRGDLGTNAHRIRKYLAALSR